MIDQMEGLSRDEWLQHFPQFDSSICYLNHIPIGCNSSIVGSPFNRVLTIADENRGHDWVQAIQVATHTGDTLVIDHSELGAQLVEFLDGILVK